MEKLSPKAIELSEKILAHLTTQKARAMRHFADGSATSSCAYLDTETGHTCAIGCLIPRERYSPEIEGSPGRSMSVASRIPELDNYNWEGDNTLLWAIMAWQSYHDSSRGPHHFPNYERWIDGDASHSPANFYAFMQEVGPHTAYLGTEFQYWLKRNGLVEVAHGSDPY